MGFPVKTNKTKNTICITLPSYLIMQTQWTNKLKHLFPLFSQAKAIFKEVLDTKPNLNEANLLWVQLISDLNMNMLFFFVCAHFLNYSVSFNCVGSRLLSLIRSLGTVGPGVSCKVLQELFRADSSPPSVRRILSFLRQQPGPLHTSLVHVPVWLMPFYELLDGCIWSISHVTFLLTCMFFFFLFFFYRKSVWLRICISLSSSLSSSRTLGPRLPCPCRKCEDAITPLLTCLRGFQMFKKSLQENCLLIICR